MVKRTADLRRKAKKAIDGLSGSRLQFAADFLAYVQERESEEATRELIAIPGFENSFRRGMKDIEAGKVVEWRKSRSGK